MVYCRVLLRLADLHPYSSLLCLYLLRTSLPHIRQASKAKPGQKASTTAAEATPSDPAPNDPVTGPTAVLSHLCEMLDSKETEEKVQCVVQDIVTEGVVVFFPDAKTRKDYLLSMISSVLVSVWGCI